MMDITLHVRLLQSMQPRWCLHDDASYEYRDFSICFHRRDVAFTRIRVIGEMLIIHMHIKCGHANLQALKVQHAVMYKMQLCIDTHQSRVFANIFCEYES